MTESEFKKYMKDFGYHVKHVYGKDIIEKPGKNLFTINGKHATALECAELITVYHRDEKLKSVLE